MPETILDHDTAKREAVVSERVARMLVTRPFVPGRWKECCICGFPIMSSQSPFHDEHGRDELPPNAFTYYWRRSHVTAERLVRHRLMREAKYPGWQPKTGPKLIGFDELPLSPYRTARNA